MQDIVLLQPLFNFWQSARLYCARRRPQEGGEHTWRPILPLFFLTTPARPLHHPCENLLVQFPPGKMINVTTTPTAAEGETPPVRSGRKAKTPFVLYFSPLLRHPNRILLGRNSTPRLSTLSVSLSWRPPPAQEQGRRRLNFPPP